ncbi:MAG: DUF6691 family protein [Planctomycetota bacterium]|nr:DUF6691 family protein [Planctomycetota bacterium]
MSTPIVGLILGAIFGASLVLAGLTDPDKIIGALRLKDFNAIRTVVVFVLVGTVGTWILQLCGGANPDIKPAAIVTILIGGTFFGVGLGLTGFSPVTALASAPSGRIDALSTIIGMLCGAHVYVLIHPSIAMPLEKIANYGKVTLPGITGSSPISWIIPIAVIGGFSLLLIRPWKSQEVGPQDAVGELTMDADFSAKESPTPPAECLEAAQVFLGWRNLAFAAIILCLLLLQTSFWLVKTGHVEAGKVIRGSQEKQARNATEPIVTEPEASAKKAANAQRQLNSYISKITFESLAWAVRIANALLVLASVLYVLTMLCTMTIPLAGRKHIYRAFYLSVVMLLVVLPWQIVFDTVGTGAIYTPDELVKWCAADSSDWTSTLLLYFRFTGYCVMALAVLGLAQLRSFLWRKAVIRELDQPQP